VTEARAFIAAKKDPEAYTVRGGDLARGVRLKWAQPLDTAGEEAFFAELRAELGEKAGFTRTTPNEVVVINYRDKGIPWLVEDDAEFVGAVGQVADRVGAETVNFWSDGDYGPTFNWKADPTGKGLLNEGSLSGRSDLHAWLRDRRAQAVRIRKAIEANPDAYVGRPGRARRAQGRGGTSPPVRDDGRVDLTHWGRVGGLEELDPAFDGSRGTRAREPLPSASGWVTALALLEESAPRAPETASNSSERAACLPRFADPCSIRRDTCSDR